MTDLVADFKRLRLYGMATGYAEYRQHILVAPHDPLLMHLVQAGTTDRALRSVRYRMHAQPTHNRAMAVRRARHREPGARALTEDRGVRPRSCGCRDQTAGSGV